MSINLLHRDIDIVFLKPDEALTLTVGSHHPYAIACDVDGSDPNLLIVREQLSNFIIDEVPAQDVAFLIPKEDVGLAGMENSTSTSTG